MTAAVALLTLGVAAVAEEVLNVEWSFPYCNDQSDGPSSAVFGAPFPYTRLSGATSLEYDTVPHLYLLNLAFWCLLAWPLVRRVVPRATGRRGRVVAAGTGILLCVLVGTGKAVVYRQAWCPTSELMRAPWESYSELRPIGFAMSRHTNCTPSAFWFGPVRPGVPMP